MAECQKQEISKKDSGLSGGFHLLGEIPLDKCSLESECFCRPIQIISSSFAAKRHGDLPAGESGSVGAWGDNLAR